MQIEDSQQQLTSVLKKKLRGIGQRLKPHVHIGRQGLSETVLAEIDTALLKNGLIKVRFEAERTVMQNYIAKIVEQLGCERVGNVGKVGIFFREIPEVETT